MELRRAGETSVAPQGPAVTDFDPIFASLTDEQRAVLAAHLNVREMGSAAPTAASNANAPGAQAPRRI